MKTKKLVLVSALLATATPAFAESPDYRDIGTIDRSRGLMEFVIVNGTDACFDRPDGTCPKIEWTIGNENRSPYVNLTVLIAPNGCFTAPVTAEDFVTQSEWRGPQGQIGGRDHEEIRLYVPEGGGSKCPQLLPLQATLKLNAMGGKCVKTSTNGEGDVICQAFEKRTQLSVENGKKLEVRTRVGVNDKNELEVTHVSIKAAP